MKELQQVTRYKCKWCGKVFATQRHDCKFDPDKRNCLSCRHCLGVIEDIEEMPDLGFGSWERRFGKFNCALEHGADDCETTALDQMAKSAWNHNCDDYEMIEGYEGSKSYAHHIIEIALNEVDIKLKTIRK